MQNTFAVWQRNRQFLKGLVSKFSLEQMNQIPSGFKNNLAWNLGHILVVQQRLVYALSGLPIHFEKAIADKYLPGTNPESPITKEELDKLCDAIDTLFQQTIKDFEDGKFQHFHPYKTHTGFEIPDWETAVNFNNFHEGVHLGYMLAMSKSLS